tara:strand:+ start:3111 stop:4028 length:918 start_codon:yes stop_codon:yes gene_type:complete
LRNKLKNILIRADSSNNIGTGHVMRSLVLADQFKNCKVTFAVQDLPGNINYRIKNAGFDIHKLGSNDIDDLISLIKKYEIDLIVIDNYGITYNEELKIKKNTGIKIFVLDDTYEKHHCDILLNHNAYAKPEKYKNIVPEHCEIRCGKQYMLLRDEFKFDYKRQVGLENIKKVVIIMGGNDHSNIALKILPIIEKFNLSAIIITTKSNKNISSLQKALNGNSKIDLYIDNNNIASLIKKCDFAIISSSLIANELFYINFPFISIKTAENQKYMYSFLKENTYYTLESFDKNELEKAIIKMKKKLSE